MAQVAVVAHRLRRGTCGIIAVLNFVNYVSKFANRFFYFCWFVLKNDLGHAIRLVACIIETEFTYGKTRLLLDDIGVDLKLPLISLDTLSVAFQVWFLLCFEVNDFQSAILAFDKIDLPT